MSGGDIRDLVAAYALGALDDADREAFEARLETDEELQQLVREYQQVTDSIGESVPAVDPPADLRERVLARARSTAQTPEAPSEPATQDEVSALPVRERRPGQVATWLALAASIAGLLWLGGQNRSLDDDAGRLRTELAVIRDSLGLAQTQLARLDTLALLLSGPDVRFATLTAEAAQPTLRLVWNAERRVLLVAASNLAPPAPGRTYQLWGIRGDEAPVSLGTFDPEADGSALLTRAMQIEPDFDLSAITDEPAGGSAGPTTTPFLVGDWRSTQ